MKLRATKNIYIVLGLLFIITITVALLLRPTHHAHPRDLKKIISSGKIRVVSENSTTGFNAQLDSISGFQYEILKKFAEELNVTVEIAMVNDLKECIDDLNKGKYDIITKYIPTTTEWLDDVSFSNPLIFSRQMLVQRIADDSDRPLIESQKELAGDSIFIPLHSPHKMRLQHLSDEIADTIHIVEVEDVTAEQLVALVSQEKIRYTICHEQLSRKLARDYANIDASLPVSLSQPYSWALNNESPQLLNKLNEFLSEFIGSLEYWELYRKYY